MYIKLWLNQYNSSKHLYLLPMVTYNWLLVTLLPNIISHCYFATCPKYPMLPCCFKNSRLVSYALSNNWNYEIIFQWSSKWTPICLHIKKFDLPCSYGRCGVAARAWSVNPALRKCDHQMGVTCTHTARCPLHIHSLCWWQQKATSKCP